MTYDNLATDRWDIDRNETVIFPWNSGMKVLTSNLFAEFPALDKFP